MRLLVLLYAAILALASCQAYGVEQPRVAYRILCKDPTASRRIVAAIEARLRASGLDIDEHFPRARLIIVAQKDVDDTINPLGWSFAITHVTNLPTDVVAARLLPMTGPEIDAVRATLIGMVKEDGFVTYVNVAHAAVLTDESLDVIVRSVVDAFVERVRR